MLMPILFRRVIKFITFICSPYYISILEALPQDGFEHGALQRSSPVLRSETGSEYQKSESEASSEGGGVYVEPDYGLVPEDEMP